jgi:hypothetical protein
LIEIGEKPLESRVFSWPQTSLTTSPITLFGHPKGTGPNAADHRHDYRSNSTVYQHAQGLSPKFFSQVILLDVGTLIDVLTERTSPALAVWLLRWKNEHRGAKL